MRAKQLFAILLTFSCSGALSAAGQTGRVAHFSHGGGAATLAAAERRTDNFGIIPMYEERRVDSLVYLNDTVAWRYGHTRRQHTRPGETPSWKPEAVKFQYFYPQYAQLTHEATVAQLREEYPTAKLVGFDRPAVKKPKARPKKAATGATVRPLLPRPWSSGRGMAAVAGLVALGWLLAGRNRKTNSIA